MGVMALEIRLDQENESIPTASQLKHIGVVNAHERVFSEAVLCL